MRRWGILAIVWVFAGWYGYVGLDRGWVPHDEGQFGEAANRILGGEMPHRDFDEMYTGALSYVHAAAFRTLGEDVRSLRLVLFGFFVLFVPAVYYVASGFGSRLTAGLVTVLATVWSIPNYPSPVPSWYNLFFTVFGLAALSRFLETDRRRWLFVAGLCGGLSFLVKLVAVYYVAGVLLFFVFRGQCLARTTPDPDVRRSRFYSLAVCVGLVTFVAVLIRAFSVGLTVPRFIAVILPAAGVSLIVFRRAWWEIRRLPGSDAARFGALLRLAVPFLAGVALPVALFLAPVALDGGLAALYREVVVLPQRRLTAASYVLPPFSLLLTAPMLILLWWVLAAGRAFRGLLAVGIVGGALTAALVGSRASIELYQLAWRPAMCMLAFGVLAAAWLFRRVDDSSDLQHQRVMLVVVVTAMCGLIQLPFPAPVYFCYVAPLVALAIAGLCSLRHPTGHPLAAALLIFYALFAAFRVTPGYIYMMGRAYAADGLSARLLLTRARELRVDPQQAMVYGRLVPLVTALASDGTLYAGPDCPEVYFLTGLPNPTRTIYEFLSEPRATTEDILAMLTARHVTVVVINTAPDFSGQMPSDLHDALRARFPYTQSVGPFEVRWLH
jgi:hypothetical protein